ncbi:MAG: hypothetical protein GWN79_11550, partial [Actinobacteria bacterium]|nr:hypothetical protein [Actinomycetota bacterium]NIS31994.1 hypothetical protein [Actinomycetota bacterium]NIT96005.1 hypothetical protein [Actinomycetota bacterium]NIU19682.1 hypothetical protein [Actinomycetota bacterium]NIU67070.1 hypothetical protein [Actinomycetota bacterium]
GPGDAGPGELLVQCTASGPPPVLNEIRIDQPGSDTDEYIELRGTPGSSMTGLSIVIIGDGVGGSGIIEEVIDLTGQVIPPGEHFLIAEGDVFGVEPDLTTGLNMENSDNVTYLLVSGFSGAAGDDLDPDDDCTLDVMPWDEVLDALGLVETTDSGDCNYGASLGFEDIGPDGTFVPAHVYRCDPEGEWRIGSFDPDDGTDTPRALNLPCCMSTLTLSPVDLDPMGYEPGDQILFELSMDVCEPVVGFQAFLTFDEAELALVSGAYTPAPFGQPIIDPIVADAGNVDLAAGIDQTIGQTATDAPAVLVELVFEAQQSFCLPESLAFRPNVPPTRLTGPAGNEVPVAASTASANSCPSDTNRDGTVDIDDLITVILAYGTAGGCSADADGSGTVDVDDIIMLITNWGPCD